MPTVETGANALTEQQLGLMIQYTVEAYKTFEKLAENLPNPMAATMFQQFAEDEREHRDLIELDGVRVALDEMAASRLDGAVIIYDAEEDGYSLDHPDAVEAAWCG